MNKISVSELFKNSLVYRTYSIMDVKRLRGRISRETTYDIYPITLLNEFLTILGEEKANNNYVFNCVRYLVTTDMKFRLAREGEVTMITPGHGQMIAGNLQDSRSLVAGNIYFNDNFSQIIGIDHESGDFNSPCDAILWSLGILFANEHLLLPLAEEFQLTLYIVNEITQTKNKVTYLVDLHELRTFVLTACNDNLLEFRNQEQEIIKINYIPNRKRSLYRDSLLDTENTLFKDNRRGLFSEFDSPKRRASEFDSLNDSLEDDSLENTCYKKNRLKMRLFEDDVDNLVNTEESNTFEFNTLPDNI